MAKREFTEDDVAVMASFARKCSESAVQLCQHMGALSMQYTGSADTALATIAATSVDQLANFLMWVVTGVNSSEPAHPAMVLTCGIIAAHRSIEDVEASKMAKPPMFSAAYLMKGVDDAEKILAPDLPEWWPAWRSIAAKASTFADSAVAAAEMGKAQGSA